MTLYAFVEKNALYDVFLNLSFFSSWKTCIIKIDFFY